MSKEIECWLTDNVVCPYCGYDMEGDCGDGPTYGKQQCDECDKNFHCEPNYSVSYTTRKIPCWNGEEHDWHINSDLDPTDNTSIKSCKVCYKSECVNKENKEIV